MITNDSIKQMRDQVFTPGYLSIIPALISTSYIVLSLTIERYVSGMIASILMVGMILTPIMLYLTIGEINELVGYAGKVSYESSCSLNEILPSKKLKQIRFDSVSLLLGAVLVIAVKSTLPFGIWFILLLGTASLLFVKALKGIQGNYRYHQFVPNQIREI